MKITPNRTILEKADLAVADLISDGGYLLPEQSSKFIRLMIKRGDLMNMATVTPMKSHKKLIEKISFQGRVLRPATEATALPLAKRVKPTLSKVELDTEELIAETRLSYTTLEDSIERGDLKQTIMEELGKAISRDLDEYAIQADTGGADVDLQVFDGLLVQATTNVVAAGGVPINKTILKNMIKLMPPEFRRVKSDLRFLTSVNAETDYRDSLGERATAAGDRHLLEDTPVKYGGVTLKPVDMFPEGLGIGLDETNILLTDPKNVVYGIWRKILLETDRDISSRELKIVATIRFDAKFAHEPAVVKATGIRVG